MTLIPLRSLSRISYHKPLGVSILSLLSTFPKPAILKNPLNHHYHSLHQKTHDYSQHITHNHIQHIKNQYRLRAFHTISSIQEKSIKNSGKELVKYQSQIPTVYNTGKPLVGGALLTKEALLSQATSPWERFAIKSKWFLIKGYRPFNIDEISAFFSWFILSHILWIILGTTTFFSLLFYALNSLFAKELVGQVMGKFITYLNPSFEIKFKDAVVPEWNDGMIDFKKVIIKTVDDSGLKLDLKVEHLKLTLSFNKWYNQKGMIDNVEIHGMTGTIDRSDLANSGTEESTNEIDWFTNKDYELGNLKIVDSFFKVLPKSSDENNKPLEFAIYSCEISKIRIKWLLADFFNASSITGSVNNSLFAIHKRQHKYAYVSDIVDDLNPWKRITRIRLDPTDIDVLGLQGTQFNWMVDGKADITADIMSPVEEDNGSLSSNYIVIDFKIQFNDLKAKLPLEEPMSSTGEKLISLNDLKPIVSYVNNRRSESFELNSANILPSLNFRVVKKIDELENVSTLTESNCLDLISSEIYVDWLKHVHEYEIEQRNKRIAQWSKTVASQLLVVGIGAMV